MIMSEPEERTEVVLTSCWESTEVCKFCGQVDEQPFPNHDGKKWPFWEGGTNWSAFIYGCFAGIIPWVVIVMYFVGSITSSGAEPPAFVYAIIPTIFVFFNIFAINMYLQYKKVGRWKDYLFGERVYIILSLLAKTALAWQIFAGTLAPV